MSVRSGILAVLTFTDAYGLQLHAELEQRTDRRGRVNVGQIYSTLERLVAAGLVRASGATDDGLPLYGLTADGAAAAEEWLEIAPIDGTDPWGEMTFKVMLAASLGHPGTARLVERYQVAWAAELRRGAEPSPEVGVAGWPGSLDRPGSTDPGALAHRRLAEAAVAWLDDLASLPGGLAALTRPLRNERPRRGRRPAASPE